MIENVLEIKDTHVREVMTPLIDVVAIDGSATLVDFHKLWVTHQYSRYIKLLGPSLRWPFPTNCGLSTHMYFNFLLLVDHTER